MNLKIYMLRERLRRTMVVAEHVSSNALGEMRREVYGRVYKALSPLRSDEFRYTVLDGCDQVEDYIESVPVVGSAYWIAIGKFNWFAERLNDENNLRNRVDRAVWGE